MPAGAAAAGRPDDGAPSPSTAQDGAATAPEAAAAEAYRHLRIPGGEPPIRTAPVSVRQTVGLPARSHEPPGLVGHIIRAGAWAVAATVVVAGSLMLYQMLFTGEAQFDDFLSTSRSGVLEIDADGSRAITNADPDLPQKADLVVPPLGPSAVVAPPVTGGGAPPADGAVATDASDSSGPGSGAEGETSGSGSDQDSSGSGSGGDDDSSGSGSGGDGDSSGSGSGGDGDSSGHGSGDDDGGASGGDGDSSGHGSGDDDGGASGGDADRGDGHSSGHDADGHDGHDGQPC